MENEKGFLQKGATISLVLRKNIIIVFAKDTTFKQSRNTTSLCLQTYVLQIKNTPCVVIFHKTHIFNLSVTWIMQLSDTSFSQEIYAQIFANTTIMPGMQILIHWANLQFFLKQKTKEERNLRFSIVLVDSCIQLTPQFDFFFLYFIFSCLIQAHAAIPSQSTLGHCNYHNMQIKLIDIPWKRSQIESSSICAKKKPLELVPLLTTDQSTLVKC